MYAAVKAGRQNMTAQQYSARRAEAAAHMHANTELAKQRQKSIKMVDYSLCRITGIRADYRPDISRKKYHAEKINDRDYIVGVVQRSQRKSGTA